MALPSSSSWISKAKLFEVCSVGSSNERGSANLILAMSGRLKVSRPSLAHDPAIPWGSLGMSGALLQAETKAAGELLAASYLHSLLISSPCGPV